MRFHVRELVFGVVLAILSNIAVLYIVESSPMLAQKLGLYSSTWVNGMLLVEILRMSAVALFTLWAIRQRQGFESRAQGVGYALTVAATSWLITMLMALVLGLIASQLFVSWSDLTSLVVWCAGALLAPIFIAPGGQTGATNHYVARLDREKSENTGW